MQHARSHPNKFIIEVQVQRFIEDGAQSLNRLLEAITIIGSTFASNLRFTTCEPNPSVKRSATFGNHLAISSYYDTFLNLSSSKAKLKTLMKDSGIKDNYKQMFEKGKYPVDRVLGGHGSKTWRELSADTTWSEQITISLTRCLRRIIATYVLH